MKIVKLTFKPYFLFKISGFVAVDRLGIQFFHYFNGMMWIWPWKRYMNNGMKWYSYVFEAPFSTVTEEKEEIDRYIAAMMESFPLASLCDDLTEDFYNTVSGSGG